MARNQELEEISDGFHVARDTVRARLRGQIDAHNGTGAVGVELSHVVHREQFKLESSTRPVSRPGWRRGQLGLPYYATGASDMERSGWVITMRGWGTAIRQRAEMPVRAPEAVLWLGG